ncbi:MAG: histidinol dehydrogenase [Chloroflexi bacterium]|nr:histidinol dehydrogenase [Chloroflexota bacterium]
MALLDDADGLGWDMRIVDSVEEAREGILKRRPLEQTALPERVTQRIAEVFGAPLTADQVVDRIIAEVRQDGDAALWRLTEAIDQAAPRSLEVSHGDVQAAYYEVAPDLVDALRLAAERIEAFHRRQVQQSWAHFSPAGALGQLIVPLRRVGVYAPGGRAVYPSTVLMTAIPARVAGVEEVILASPPGPDGEISPLVLVAADIARVDRVFAMGGAQAIAALAYGTETVPLVDKILGPGNLFVALAKKKVFGQVAIDQIAGPTETVIVADHNASPRAVALDLLAQAEHDPLATALLITTSRSLAEAVAREVDALLGVLPRADITRQALDSNGGAVIVADVAEALTLANEYAPEHLCLLVADPWAWLGHVRNAGGVFLGEHSPEAMGDYIAGPSHVMPTNGTARFASPLNILDFIKVVSVIALGDAEVQKLGPAAAAIAEAEGLTAHAAAIRARLAGNE